MKLIFTEQKNFTEQQVQDLFLSVGWVSGQYPSRLHKALLHSPTVITVWDQNKLVGLARVIDDGELVAFLHYVLVRPDYQHQGIAGKMLQMIIEKYKDYLYIEGMPEERKNADFYKQYGFHVMADGVALCAAAYLQRGLCRGHPAAEMLYCRSKKETGMSCTSANFSEEELKRISARTLGMQGFDEAEFEKAVRDITVMESGDPEFRLAGGKAKIWKNLHLDPPRHIATVTDCFQGKVKCAACGNTYHRVNSAGKWVYWYCIGKKRKNVECHNPNCTDYKLRQVSAYMMGLDEFSEAEFEEQIEEITAFPNGSLEFHFKEGRAERWQRA